MYDNGHIIDQRVAHKKYVATTFLAQLLKYIDMLIILMRTQSYMFSGRHFQHNSMLKKINILKSHGIFKVCVYWEAIK